MSQGTVLTHSMLASFRNCRKACQWRYVENLVPNRREPSLSFGSLMHECLEIWHRDRKLGVVLDHIDSSRSGPPADPSTCHERHMARAMMRAYATHYPTEDFEVVALEQPFEGPIIDPATGHASPDFMIAGKIDGIVRRGGEHHIIEHKTTSYLDAGYLERLWIDSQITLYTLCARELLGISIVGVIYNVLVKPRLRAGAGESEDSFQARLTAKCAEPGMFHREQLYISADDLRAMRAELWELAGSFWDARHRNTFYRNTDHCHRYGRSCPYLPLCRSDGNPGLIENLYRQEAPHEELRKKSPTASNEPITTKETL